MRKKSNTIIFTRSEKTCIKELIDKRYGKETTTSDYDSTSGHYDMGIEGHFLECTGERISGSTLERLAGLRGENNSGVSLTTLKIVLKYLNLGSVEQLLQLLERKQADKMKRGKRFNALDLIHYYDFCLHFNNDKYLRLHFLNEFVCKVIESLNLKLEKGDIIEIISAVEKEELICSKITRTINKKITSLGRYRSGNHNHIVSIELIKRD